jgi:glycosyltransferase involved in cell wall biosynthesis
MCQDGLQISGVGTVGLGLFKHDPLCHLLFLNVDEEIPVTLQKESRFFHLNSTNSHDPVIVARKLAEIASKCKGPKVAVLPNTGDTNYGAALECLRDSLVEIGKQLSIFGIIHGDQKNPYEVIRHYEPSISFFAGISTRCRDRLKDYIPHRSNQISWLPPATRTSDSPSPSKDSQPLRMLYLGRLVRQHKCVHRLHELAIELKKRKIPFWLTIIGDGPERESLESDFKSSGFSETQIQFLGRIPNDSLPELLNAQDLILSVSSTEGSPNSILEGMGAGLCPVAMDIDSGLRDFIVHNHNGIIVEQGDMPGMAKAIKELDQNRSRLNSFKIIAHRSIASGFSISAQISKLHELISSESAPICIEKVNGLSHYMDANVHRTVNRVLEKNLSECAVYGAGMYGRKLIDALLLEKIRPSVIFDSYALNADRSYKNIPIVNSEKILEFNVNTFVIGSVDFHQEIEKRIKLCFANAGKTPPMLLNHCTCESALYN